MTRDQQGIFDWIRTAPLFADHKCDNYDVVIDESRSDGEWLSKFWLRQIMSTQEEDAECLLEILVPYL